MQLGLVSRKLRVEVDHLVSLVPSVTFYMRLSFAPGCRKNGGKVAKLVPLCFNSSRFATAVLHLFARRADTEDSVLCWW